MTELPYKDYIDIVLDEAIKLIDRGWTTGTFARNDSGEKVLFDSPEATKFCLLGAIRKSTEQIPDWLPSERFSVKKRICNRIKKILKKRKTVGVVRFNDNVAKTKRAVINLLKKAKEIND